MKVTVLAMASLLWVAGLVPAWAQIVPTPITAEQAFDAVQSQTDPVTGAAKRVVLVDVRSRAENYWVGQAAKVNSITFKDGTVVVPDMGKVKLQLEGAFITYRVRGRFKVVQTRKVASMSLAPIAYHVPYEDWSESNGALEPNDEFQATMTTLAGTDMPVVILFCRSGGRTDGTNCGSEFDSTLFDSVYEIDQPDGATNHGGMEGSAYANAYNGYRGFPDRYTRPQDHPSVSWKDAGLPILIGKPPLTVPLQQ